MNQDPNIYEIVCNDKVVGFHVDIELVYDDYNEMLRTQKVIGETILGPAPNLEKNDF